MPLTKEQLVELISKTIPYANQTKGWDWSSEADAVRFTWRDTRFRVDCDLYVETVDGAILVGNNESLLLRALLEQTNQRR